jgi:hypothetical protein
MWLLVVVALLVWAGATLLIDGWLQRPRRVSLDERLAPFQRRYVADEAQEWLKDNYEGTENG